MASTGSPVSGPLRLGAPWSWKAALLLCLVVSLVVAVLPPAKAILASVPLLMAALFVLLLPRPTWALVLLLASFYNPAVTFARLNLSIWSYAVTFGLFATASAVLLLRRRGTFPRSWRTAGFALTILTIVTCMAALNGLWHGNDLQYIISDTAQVLELAGFCWLTMALLWHFGGVRLLLGALLPIFLVTAAWEQFLYQVQDTPLLRALYSAPALRTTTLGNGFVLAAFNPAPAIYLPVLAAVLLLARRHLPRWARVCLYLALVFAMMSVAQSFKRSVWLAEAVAVVIILALSTRVLPLARVARLALGSVLMGGVMVGALGLIPRGGTSLLHLIGDRIAYTSVQFETKANPGIESRRSEYTVVGKGLEQSPILGAGLGAKYIGHVPEGGLAKKHFMHNTFLAVTFRMGVVGLSALLATLAVLVLTPLGRLRSMKDPLETALVIGSLASVSMLALQALTTGTLLSHPFAAYGGFLLGLTHYLVSRSSAPSRSGQGHPAYALSTASVVSEGRGTGNPPSDAGRADHVPERSSAVQRAGHSILWFAPHFQTGKGAGGLRTWILAKHLGESGHLVSVLVPGWDPLTGKRLIPKGKLSHTEQIDGVELVYVWSSRNDRSKLYKRILYFLTSSTTAFFVALWRPRPELVLAANYPPTLAMTGLLIAWLTGSPFVLEVRDFPAEAAVASGYVRNRLLGKLVLWMERILFRPAKTIVTVAPGMKRRMIELGVREEKIAVVPNGYEETIFEAADSSIDIRKEMGWSDRFVVLYAGTMGHIPDLPTLLKTASLTAKDEGILYVLIGAGQREEEYRDYCRSHGLENCQFLGRKPRREIPAFCRAADICVNLFPKHPFWGTILGNKTFDYLGSGTAYVYCGSEPSDTGEVLRASGGGLVVAPEDPEALSATIKYLRAHPAERSEMGRTGQAYVIEKFARRKLARDFDLVLRAARNEEP